MLQLLTLSGPEYDLCTVFHRLFHAMPLLLLDTMVQKTNLALSYTAYLVFLCRFLSFFFLWPSMAWSLLFSLCVCACTVGV